MPAYPVDGTRPNQLSGIYSDPYVIRNDGVFDVYLGQDSSLTPGTRELTLTPGSTTTWNGQTELWALCNRGEAVEVELIFTADMSFSPGPKIVDVQSIIGTVTVDGIVQTKQVATATLLDSATTNVPSGSGALQVFSQPITGLTQYNSVLITYECSDPGFLTPQILNSVLLTCDNGATQPACEFYLFAAFPSMSRLQFPVTGDTLVYSLSFLRQALPAGVVVKTKVYGTYAPITEPVYSQQGAWLQPFENAPYINTYTAVGSNNDWPPTTNDMQIVGLRKGSGALAATATAFTESRGTASVIGGQSIIAGDPVAFAPQIQIYPRYAPMRINTNISTAGTLSLWATR